VHSDNINNRLETEWFIHCEGAKNFSIQNNTALCLHIDESRIRQALLSHTCIQTLYPQLPEFTLLHLKVDEENSLANSEEKTE